MNISVQLELTATRQGWKWKINAYLVTLGCFAPLLVSYYVVPGDALWLYYYYWKLVVTSECTSYGQSYVCLSLVVKNLTLIFAVIVPYPHSLSCNN